MTSVETIGAIAIRIVKLILNLIILIMYRTGNHGSFLGVGGTWNLNEEKTSDVEIIASGVFVGYFIYTAVSLMSLLFGTRDNKIYFTDVIMGVVGVFMWLTVGAAALHYWHGFIDEHKYVSVSSERTEPWLTSSLIGFIPTLVLSICHFPKAQMAFAKPYGIGTSIILSYWWHEVGLIMGSLCILTAALYLLDSVVSVLFVVREKINGQY